MTSALQIAAYVALTSVIVGVSTRAVIWLFSRP